MQFLIINNYSKNSIEKYKKILKQIKTEIQKNKPNFLNLKIISIRDQKNLKSYIFLSKENSSKKNQKLNSPKNNQKKNPAKKKTTKKKKKKKK